MIYCNPGSDAERYANENGYATAPIPPRDGDDTPVTPHDDTPDTTLEDAFLSDAIDVTDETMISNGDFSEFDELWLNGKKLVRGVDYEAEEGSTEDTVFAKTLQNNVVEGENTIVMTFRDENGDLKKTAQNFRAVKEQVGVDYSNFGGVGGGSEETESEAAAEHKNAQNPNNENVVYNTDGTAVETKDGPPKVGSVVNTTLAAVSLLGAVTAFSISRRKRRNNSKTEE